MQCENKCDPTLAIQQFLELRFSRNAEKCTIAVEASETINWKKQYRIIGLIRKRFNHAIVIFTAKKLADCSLNNIRVIDVIPLNNEMKILPDSSRSSNGESQPALLTGEDFTLLNFDPLSSDSHKTIPEDNPSYHRKRFQLDFSKEDFRKFTFHINNASQFIKNEELFCNFDWLQRLRDEAESSSDISNDQKMSELELDSKTLSDDSNSRNSLKRISDSNDNLIGYHYSNAQTSSNQISMENLDRSQPKMFDNKNLQNHFQSTPDLLNVKDRFSTVNDDKQNEYVENKLRQKEDDYCNWEDHTLFVGTWNVNGRIDENSSLDDWLSPPEKEKFPTFYVIGFQELDLSIQSVALNRGNINNLEEKWLKLIESSEPFKNNKYRRLHRARLAGILLVVYVDLKYLQFIPDGEIVFYKVPTGMLNLMGNKGGVGIRFQAWNSNLCFINCHLAAGESNRIRRDQDFREIEKNMIFKNQNEKSYTMYNHDLVFLMGDLNYRLINIEASEAKEIIQRQDVALLRENDELRQESYSVFSQFHEGEINFMPTYKFDANTDDYDTSEKNRVPSYCDRIMWRGEHCKLKLYSSHTSLKSSDHKPVSAWFNIGLKKIDEKKRMRVQESIIRSLDLIYNLSLPQAKVDRQEIHFEDIHFYENRQASITLKNIGQYEFLFKFKEIPGCPKIPDWLTVRSSEGKVKPGEEFELIFEIFINANNVAELNTKKEVQCILVLELQGGKDYFITISADLVPTCFGLPLSLLVILKQPIGTLTRDELFEKCKSYVKNVSVPNQNSSGNEFTTPKEVFTMLDYLMKHVQEEELFARPGYHADIQVIREQLDLYGINANFDTVSVHSVTETLIIFLNSLYFPIIPEQLTKECMGVYNNFMESVKVIGKLPQDHKNLFHYLTSFLRRVLDNHSYNGTDLSLLAMLFVDIIFRPRNRELERDICAQFIRQFLVNDPVKYFRNNSVPAYQ